MITAEEYCREHQNNNHPDMISKLMIEFTKLHVQAALEAVANKVILTEFAVEFLQEGSSDAIDKDSILNA